MIVTYQSILAEKKQRLASLYHEMEGLRDEIDDLQGEADRLENDINRAEKAMTLPEESVIAQLLQHVRSHWKRFTWTETQIVERAAEGDDLDNVEQGRLKLLAMQELHIVGVAI